MKTDSFRFIAVIPAAGIGRRMGSDIPKQYLSLSGKTVLDWTISKLLSHPGISELAVVISKEDCWWRESDYSKNQSIKVVNGGAERCHSVLNALKSLRETFADEDRVLVHDAARPCVKHEDITRLINEAGYTDDGGLLGVPVKDTMKRTDNRHSVQSTLERVNMWHAFTPQLFPLGLLHDAMQSAFDQGSLVTDESSAMELAGFHPKMVEGSADNLKITRPEDLALASFYLQQQH